MTKAPTPTEKSKKQRDNTKTPPKTSITQRLRADLGRSVGVTIATQLVWLNRTEMKRTLLRTMKFIRLKYNKTLDIGCQTDKAYFESAESLNDKEKSFLENIICLLPIAIQYLSEHNQLQVWVLLFKYLANRTLPLHNISYRIFLDVGTWFSSENTCTLRYSDIVKRFWRTGCELFKGIVL